MSNSILLPPAHRSTRTELAIAEQHQTEVTARLRTVGEDRLADRIGRCQHDRQHRQPGSWPWRCRSGGCWACRRTITRRWFRGFLQWLGASNTSLVTIPITATDNVLTTIRRLRKSLRDVRDRVARTDPAWRAVAMCGLVSGNMLLLVRHHGIDQDMLWLVLERRWPDVMVTAPGNIEPNPSMTVDTAVALAMCRRGVEPIRVVVPAQRAAQSLSATGWQQPMPVLV